MGSIRSVIDTSNMTLIRGEKAGSSSTLSPLPSPAAALALANEHQGAAVVAVLITHSHADHSVVSSAWLAKSKYAPARYQ